DPLGQAWVGERLQRGVVVGHHVRLRPRRMVDLVHRAAGAQGRGEAVRVLSGRVEEFRWKRLRPGAGDVLGRFFPSVDCGHGVASVNSSGLGRVRIVGVNMVVAISVATTQTVVKTATGPAASKSAPMVKMPMGCTIIDRKNTAPSTRPWNLSGASAAT